MNDSTGPSVDLGSRLISSHRTDDHCKIGECTRLHGVRPARREYVRHALLVSGALATTLWVVIGCAGLAVGSFLNVVIYRVPRHESLLRPGSHCPDCGHELSARDNVPVVSWLMLRRRCRYCREPIAARYPSVELGTMALFLVATARLGLSAPLPAYLIWLSGLLALALIDAEHLVLPRSIVYVTFALTEVLLLGASAAAHDWRRLGVAALCGVIWSGVFFVINFLSPRYLGFGDVRLALLLGVGLGWLGVGHVIVGFFLANLLGALIGLSLIAAGKLRRDQPIPYGIFLATGSALALFLGPALEGWVHLPS